MRRIPREHWDRYVTVRGLSMAEVQSVHLVDHPSLSRDGVIIKTKDGTNALLPVGGSLSLREVDLGNDEIHAEVSIDGAIDFDYHSLSSTSNDPRVAANPELARLAFHEEIGLVSPEVAREVRCSWFGIDCAPANQSPEPSAQGPGSGILDGFRTLLAQWGNPSSNGRHIGGNCVSQERYAFWQYGCFDRYEGPRGTFGGSPGRYYGTISRQSAGGRNTGFLFVSGTRVFYTGSGRITDWFPTSKTRVDPCARLTIGASRRGLSLSLAADLCENHGLKYASGTDHENEWSFLGGRRQARSSVGHTWAHKRDGASDMGHRFTVYVRYSNF